MASSVSLGDARRLGRRELTIDRELLRQRRAQRRVVIHDQNRSFACHRLFSRLGQPTVVGHIDVVHP
jgi:IS30 family transposase